MEIGKIIRLRRKQLKMTQEQLALEVNSDAGNLSRIERGKQSIPLDKIDIYAKALHCSAADLLGAEEEIKRPTIPAGFLRLPKLSVDQVKDWEKLKNHIIHLEIADWFITSADISRDSFSFEVADSSMLLEFKIGEIIVVDPEVLPEAGDIVLALNTEQRAVLLRKYKQRGVNIDGETSYELQPLNDDFETLSSLNLNLIIIGVVVEHRKFRSNRIR